MRKDFFKVIVERPRLGGRCSKGRYNDIFLSELDEEINRYYSGETEKESGTYTSFKKSMKPCGPGMDRKSLNENLAPLRRFLESCIGKNWNDVYSEIKQSIDCNSAVQKHVVDHINQYVRKDTVLLEDGRIIVHEPYYEFCVVNDFSNGIDRWRFHVHPITNVLCQSSKRYRFRYETKRYPTHETYQLNKLEQYRNIDGNWFHVELTNYRNNSGGIPWSDCVFKFNYTNEKGINFATEYGNENLRAISKRQCGTKEIVKIIRPLIASNPENYFTPKNS